MAGIVPAVPLARPQPGHAARLVDHHPASSASGNGSLHRFCWGSVEVLSCSGGHRVERIEVKTGQSMPLHYHHHRSEHWTIVSGEAEISLGDDVMIAAAEDSLYIPAGSVHGLKAGSCEPVTLVAVHFGDRVSDDEDLFPAA